jgi:beta-N-acetylhexosaminidase
VGGLVLFGNEAPLDLGSQLKDLEGHALRAIAPFVMTDEEGGLVQRMANLVGDVPAPRLMGETMTAAGIDSLAFGLGRRLRAAGVTMDLAPVLDVDGGVGPNARDPDGTRSFSPIESVAARDGVAFARGLQRGGVVAVAKHFPGLGGASGNTDDGPAATVPWPNLERSGLKPFEAAISSGIDAVMVSNASVPGLVSIPASLSSQVVTTVLRGELGFKGLVMTDSLSALAIRDIGLSVPQATLEALEAGEDLVLYQAPGPSPDALTNQIIATVVQAVRSGVFLRSQLQSEVGYVLAAKHENLCSARS